MQTRPQIYVDVANAIIETRPFYCLDNGFRDAAFAPNGTETGGDEREETRRPFFFSSLSRLSRRVLCKTRRVRKGLCVVVVRPKYHYRYENAQPFEKRTRRATKTSRSIRTKLVCFCSSVRRGRKSRRYVVLKFSVFWYVFNLFFSSSSLSPLRVSAGRSSRALTDARVPDEISNTKQLR